jgi:hypothetical protein
MPPITIISDSSSEADEWQQAFLLQIAGMAIVIVAAAIVVYAALYDKTPPYFCFIW